MKTHDRLIIQFEKKYRKTEGHGEGWPAGALANDLYGARQMSKRKKVQFAALYKDGKPVIRFKDGERVFLKKGSLVSKSVFVRNIKKKKPARSQIRRAKRAEFNAFNQGAFARPW